MTKPIAEGPSTPIHTHDHTNIRALLPEYVSIRMLGQDIPPSWHPLESHLAHCPTCRQETEALLQLLSHTLETDQVAPHPPPPDLSFLRVSTPPLPKRHPPMHHTLARQIRIQFSAAILPSMRVMMAARSGTEQLQYVFHFSPQQPADPDVSVEVFTYGEAAERGRVRVTVELPDSDPFDQAGSSVALSTAGFHIDATTNHDGTVSLNDVPIDQIESWSITVTPRMVGRA